MLGLFGSRQSTVSAPVAVGNEVEVPVASPYCTSLQCICGRDCHNNPDYHLMFTTWDGEYPQLQGDVDEGLYERAMATLGGG